MSQLFNPVRIGRHTLAKPPGHGTDDPVAR